MHAQPSEFVSSVGWVSKLFIATNIVSFYSLALLAFIFLENFVSQLRKCSTAELAVLTSQTGLEQPLFYASLAFNGGFYYDKPHRNWQSGRLTLLTPWRVRNQRSYNLT